MRSKQPNGFTLIELLICFAIVGITAGICIGMVNRNFILPNKQQCINAGGKWSEGIQYGRITQLCTYN